MTPVTADFVVGKRHAREGFLDAGDETHKVRPVNLSRIRLG
jgi:hypothetical protein